MMKHCETCRFMAAEREDRWDDSEHPTEPGKVIGFVEHTRRTCVRIIHGNSSKAGYVGDAEPTTAQPAMVVDGSGYSARLLVLPMFGCVLHEPTL